MKHEIPDNLYNDIKEFCQLNNMNIDEFINKIIKDGFTRNKYQPISVTIKRDTNDNQEKSNTDIYQE